MALGAMAALMTVMSWFGSERLADLEVRVDEPNRLLNGKLVDASSLFDADLRELEDQAINLKDQIDDLQQQLFFLGFDLSAPAPVVLEDFDQDRWCSGYEVAVTESEVRQRGDPLTVGGWLGLIRGPLVDAGCPANRPTLSPRAVP